MTVPLKRQVDIDDRAHPLRHPELEPRAAHRDVQFTRQIAREPNPAAELHRAAAHHRGQLVELHPARIEREHPVDRVERARQRKIPDAAVGNRRAAREDRLAKRSVDGGGEIGATRSPHVVEEPLKDAEVGVAIGLHGDPLVAQIDEPAEPKVRVHAFEPKLVDLHRAVVERHPDRRRVLERVVEQPHVERVDRAVDEQVVHVGQAARHANRAAGHRRRKGRQTWHERPDVGIERHVVEANGELRLTLRRHRDVTGGGDGEAGRGRVDLAAQLGAAQRQGRGDLADSFFADEQIVDAEPVVVARSVERRAAVRGKFRDSRQWRLRKTESRDALDRNALPVDIERIGRIPPDERGAGHRAAAFLDVDAVETDAGVLESQRRGRRAQGLAVGDETLERHAAEADRMQIAPGEMKLAGQQSRTPGTGRCRTRGAANPDCDARRGSARRFR